MIDPNNNGKAAPHRNVLLSPNFWMAHQVGHWVMGLVMVARLICQAKVPSVQVSKTYLAEMAMGLNSTKTEFCINAKAQKMANKIHLFLDGVSAGVMTTVSCDTRGEFSVGSSMVDEILYRIAMRPARYSNCS